uniref:Putative secreted peptide n=1 Tax=Anopheles braziliensis TaxID=58242 RepID=A0A2M3ZW79_9DIPT
MILTIIIKIMYWHRKTTLLMILSSSMCLPVMCMYLTAKKTPHMYTRLLIVSRTATAPPACCPHDDCIATGSVGTFPCS